MRHTIISIVLAALLLVPTIALTAPSVYPTGTTIYKPEKTFNGFTILSGADGKLVDMNGNLVKMWPGTHGFPNKIYPGGYLLTSTGSWAHGYQDQIRIELRDFADKVVFSFDKFQKGKANKGEGTINLARQHHDYQIKGNPVGYYIPGRKAIDPTKGTMLVLAHHNPKVDKINTNIQLIDDIMYEIDMASGEIVWTWKASEHFNEFGFDEVDVKAMQSYNAKYHKGEGEGFDWWHQNCASYLGPNKWFDQGDSRFHPDNIIFDSRDANILAIIDHATGNVVWKTGPKYDQGEDKNLGWMIGIHHTHMIPKGLPGEGNILVYDNGGWAGYGQPNAMSSHGEFNVWRDYSRVVEFDPTTKRIIWEYSPKALKMFNYSPYFKNIYLFAYKEYSPFISSAQRLPNGNTMITEGATGRLIEVTKDLEVVWEYISPYLYSAPPVGNILYRAYRVGYDWVPQLPKGKEVAVDPGMNYGIQIPAVDGSKPDIGHGKTNMWNKPIGSN